MKKIMLFVIGLLFCILTNLNFAWANTVYGSFTGAGIWQWDGSDWTKLTPDNPQAMAAAGSHLYGKFGNGIWQWNGSGWSKLTPDRPAEMVAAGSNLYGNFTGNGIWQWNGSGWSQLTTDNPESMVAAGSNLYGSFTGSGIWQWNGSGWNKLTPDRPAEMVAAGSNLYGSFTGNGIWQWNGSGWSQLTSDIPEAMSAAGSNLYGKFGNGIWQWNGSGWSKLTPDKPASMASAGSNLYGSFTGNGIWQWNGSGWSQLTSDNPALMAVCSSSAKAMTVFTLNGIAGAINEEAKTISVTVPDGTDVKALVATFTATGFSVKVGSTVQTSGSTANDFTSPVTYTVTAADGSTQDYILTVAVGWTQKADFGGIMARSHAVGFTIGSKGYIGTGNSSTSSTTKREKDFWEYDPSTNIWTQKADFGGGERDSAVGFSIGSKGYVGTGRTTDIIWNKDFWEYDPVENIWTQKANFGGTARYSAVGFSIGSKGYVGTGYDGTGRRDFWMYDPATNIWTQKADFGGAGRHIAFGLSIGSNGYVGMGWNDSSVAYKDFWEYNPAVGVGGTWTQKADFGGGVRSHLAGFSIDGRGYIGMGCDSYDTVHYTDFWEYNPAVGVGGTWTQKADFGGGERNYPVGFTIGSKGYIGTGRNSSNIFKDFWEYTPAP